MPFPGLPSSAPGAPLASPRICLRPTPKPRFPPPRLVAERSWHNPLPEAAFGPHIEWREHSFMQVNRVKPHAGQ
jgi:hypothetical protein